jgi:hypothetical protein
MLHMCVKTTDQHQVICGHFCCRGPAVTPAPGTTIIAYRVVPPKVRHLPNACTTTCSTLQAPATCLGRSGQLHQSAPGLPPAMLQRVLHLCGAGTDCRFLHTGRLQLRPEDGGLAGRHHPDPGEAKTCPGNAWRPACEWTQHSNPGSYTAALFTFRPPKRERQHPHPVRKLLPHDCLQVFPCVACIPCFVTSLQQVTALGLMFVL